MNKQEILAELAAKFEILGKVALNQLSVTDEQTLTEEGMKWYIAHVWEKQGKSLIGRNIHFYVRDEGEISEVAFYHQALPTETLQTTPVTIFRDIVLAEIEKKIAANVIVKGVIDSVNETAEYAIINAYKSEMSDVIIKRYFVYNDTAAKLQFTEIKE